MTLGPATPADEYSTHSAIHCGLLASDGTRPSLTFPDTAPFTHPVL